MLDLENASSNDQTFTHSDLRRVARSIPQFIPGTDYICSDILQHLTMITCSQVLTGMQTIMMTG